jgi:hypothetical protein
MAGPACGDAQITLSLGHYLVAPPVLGVVHDPHARGPTVEVRPSRTQGPHSRAGVEGRKLILPRRRHPL